MNEKKLYTIGETAVVTGLSTKTIRYYDSIGLVTPEIKNPTNNYRYYTNEQVVCLCMVKRMRRMNCSIEEIQKAVQAGDIETLLQQIKNRMVILQQEIDARRDILQNSCEFVNRLEQAVALKQQSNEENQFNEYLLANMSIEEIPLTKVFSIRRTVPNYNNRETSIDFWNALYDACEESGIKNSGPSIVTYHSGLLQQFVMQDCDLEFSVRIGDTVDENAHIKEFGGFLAATAIYMGTYERIIETYLSLLQWVNRNGYKTVGPTSEEFIIAPPESPNQQNQIIKIIIPIEKY